MTLPLFLRERGFDVVAMRLLTACAVAVAAALILASTGFAQSIPEFQLGFRALAEQVPQVVGSPVEDEHWGERGDSLQGTTRGLMVWRKADNWTVFTDGSRTWVNGPVGVQQRRNDERFSWEAAEQGTRLVAEGSPLRSALASPQYEGSKSGQVGLPARLTIPAIGVDAEFEFVGLTPAGAMEAPKDPDKVAWYLAGPRPGAPGNAAVAGHVDWGGKVRPFWRLSELKPGDTIEVLAGDGTYRFAVQWSRWYDANESLLGDVFGSSSVPEITLITCGGEFDRQTRQYLSRMVVRAVLDSDGTIP